MSKPLSFFEQIRANAVALISLTVAITSLAYNTWRNELTEDNRNVRTAGFQLMEDISSLQAILLKSRYQTAEENAVDDDSYYEAWSHALSIKDLSFNMPADVQQACVALFETWEGRASTYTTSDVAYNELDRNFDATKEIILKAIMELD